jgi:photosystem II stability/assembly factor-like uncharacterized protein
MKKVNKLLFITTLLLWCFNANAITYAKTPPTHRIGGGNTQKIQAQKALLLDVAMAGKRLIAVGERGQIIYSDDLGEKWKNATVPTDSLLTAVCFPTEQKGWAVGHNGIILHSQDGGETWSKQLDGVLADKLALAKAQDRLEAFKVEMGKAGEAERESMDRELDELEYQVQTFKEAATEGGWKPFLDVWFLDEENGIAAGAFGMIFGTHDGGATWEPWMDRMPNSFGYHYNSIAQSGSALLIAGEAGTLYRSMDKGSTWDLLDSPYGGSFFGILSTDNTDDKDHHVIIYGMRGRAFCSTDMGESWRVLKTGVIDSLGGATKLRDGTTVMCTYSGKMIREKEDRSFDIRGDSSIGCSGILQRDENSIITVGFNGVSLINLSDSNDRRRQ